MTGALHFQVHPCAVQELLIDPLPEGATRDGALYPEGARLTDLKEVRDLVYKMQRPAIAPNVGFSFLPFSSLLVPFPSAYANDTTSSLSLVGISSRLDGEGPDLVPQPWHDAHRRWHVWTRSGARVTSVPSCCVR